MLRGKNCRLRPLEPEDLTLLQKWENDPEHWQRGEGRQPYSRYILGEYLQNARQSLAEAGQIRFVIEYQNRGVGLVDLFDYSEQHLRAAVGIIIGDMAVRQKGLAIEALQLLAHYAHQQWNIQQLYADVRADNTASLRLFDKAGYRKVGTRKRWLRQGEQFVDLALYELLLKA